MSTALNQAQERTHTKRSAATISPLGEPMDSRMLPCTVHTSDITATTQALQDDCTSAALKRAHGLGSYQGGG